MSKKELKLFRSLIFLFGLVIIAVAYFSAPIKEDIQKWRVNYLWISIAASYIAIFFPLFFPPRDTDSSGGAFISGGMYYISDGVFAAVSILLAILVNNGAFLSLFWPLLLQGILFFFFLIQVYLCVLTAEHISSVSRMENQKKASVTDLRQYSQMLSITASSLGSDNAELKKELDAICNELRYLSPSDNATAKNIVRKLFLALQEISEDPIFTSREASNFNAMKKAAEISLLIKQRKAIY